MSCYFSLRTSAAFLCVALFSAQPVLGQRGRGISDDQIVRESMLVASGNRVALYQHGLVVDPALLHVAEEDLPRMEALLGLKFDEATFGRKIRIYVSASIAVSHVWRGYELPRDPRAIILLNPMVARLAITGANATLTHEMTHLLTWRYHSHTLREGIADYVALSLHPGAGVGPNVQGYGAPPTVRPEVEKYLGTTMSPPDAAESDREFRKEYYFASYRFVKFLIERKGIPVFLQLYNSKDPQAAFPDLYGAGRAELVLAARDEH
jgi:hypothetical protein